MVLSTLYFLICKTSSGFISFNFDSASIFLASIMAAFSLAMALCSSASFLTIWASASFAFPSSSSFSNCIFNSFNATICLLAFSCCSFNCGSNSLIYAPISAAVFSDSAKIIKPFPYRFISLLISIVLFCNKFLKIFNNSIKLIGVT